MCLAIGLQARTVYVPMGKDSEKIYPDEKKVVFLNVDANGKVSIDGKEMDLSEVEDHLRGQEADVVHILAESGVKMGVIDALKQVLRKVGKLKIMYSSPSGKSGITRYLPPFSPNKDVKVVSAQESFQGVNREDILVVRINSAGKYFFGNRPTQDDEEMLRLYATAKCFALPSIFEGVGLVALDAAACGCDIVITKLGGPHEYYSDMASMVNPMSVDEIGTSIKEFLEGKTFQPELSKYVQENFSPEKNAELLGTIYEMGK